MYNKKCIICGQNTDHPVKDAFSHFHLYRSGNFGYLKGNIKRFGFFRGLICTIGIIFPIFSTIRHWKNRKKYLIVDDK